MSMRERSGIGWAMAEAKGLVREVAGIVAVTSKRRLKDV